MKAKIDFSWDLDYRLGSQFQQSFTKGLMESLAKTVLITINYYVNY
jgi:hypothetical protein